MPQNPWTPDDKNTLRRLVASGLNDREIGERMNRQRSEICRQRAKLRLNPGQSPIFTAMMARINYRRMVRRSVRM